MFRNCSEITHDKYLSKCPSASSENLDIALNTESSSVLEHKNYAESIVASRDSIKARKKSTIYGIELVLLGREDQDHIHYAMPMRNMGYDYGT